MLLYWRIIRGTRRFWSWWYSSILSPIYKLICASTLVLVFLLIWKLLLPLLIFETFSLLILLRLISLSIVIFWKMLLSPFKFLISRWRWALIMTWSSLLCLLRKILRRRTARLVPIESFKLLSMLELMLRVWLLPWLHYWAFHFFAMSMLSVMAFTLLLRYVFCVIMLFFMFFMAVIWWVSFQFITFFVLRAGTTTWWTSFKIFFFIYLLFLLEKFFRWTYRSFSITFWLLSTWFSNILRKILWWWSFPWMMRRNITWFIPFICTWSKTLFLFYVSWMVRIK